MFSLQPSSTTRHRWLPARDAVDLAIAVLSGISLWSQGRESVDLVKSIAPANHTTTAATSTLSKLATWHLDGTLARLRQVKAVRCGRIATNPPGR